MGVAIPLENHSHFILKIQRCATELLLFEDRVRSIMRIDDICEKDFAEGLNSLGHWITSRHQVFGLCRQLHLTK